MPENKKPGRPAKPARESPAELAEADAEEQEDTAPAKSKEELAAEKKEEQDKHFREVVLKLPLIHISPLVIKYQGKGVVFLEKFDKLGRSIQIEEYTNEDFAAYKEGLAKL